MAIRNRALKLGRLVACLAPMGLVLMTGAGTASAHSGGFGGGGLSHAGTSSSMSSASMSLGHVPSLSSARLSTPAVASPGVYSPAMSPLAPGLDPPATMSGTSHRRGTSTGAADQQPATTTPAVPSISASCETDVSANCEATQASRYTVSSGDPAPVWTAPTPTAIPGTTPAPAIVEPDTATGPILEQSGGSSRPTPEGGGPTLADCMALWDPAVHMTKQLWQTVCVRTMNGINEPMTALTSVDPSAASHGKAHASRVAHN